MNTHHASVAVALASAFVFGCASNPHKEVRSAEYDLTETQAEVRNDEAKLAEDHREEQARAARSGQDRDDAAEMQRAQSAERAEQRGDGNVAVSERQADLATAQSDMIQHRREYEARAKERMTKIEAKAKELKTKSARLDATKKNAFNSHMTTFSTQKTDAKAKIGKLPAAADDAWMTAKRDVDAAFDNLEVTIDKLEEDL